MLAGLFALISLGCGIYIIVVAVKNARGLKDYTEIIAGVIVGGFLILAGSGIAIATLHYGLGVF